MSKCKDCGELEAVDHEAIFRITANEAHEGRCCDCFDAKVLGIPVEEVREKDRERREKAK